MAKKAPKEATYECIQSCTFNVPLDNGKFYNHFFKQEDEAASPDQAELSVPQGTVVSKHFRPMNDVASADRKAQIETPKDFIHTKSDLTLLAEIMVKEGFFRTRQDAIEAIEGTVDQSTLDDSDPEETKRIACIADLMGQGKDDKERRQIFGKLLKKAKVTYFPGGAPAKLAELVYDNGLYEAPEED